MDNGIIRQEIRYTLQVSRITSLWHSLPSQLSKENRKFLYKVIRTGARAKDYEDALTWVKI